MCYIIQEAQRAAKAGNQKNDNEKVSSDLKAGMKEKKSTPVILVRIYVVVFRT